MSNNILCLLQERKFSLTSEIQLMEYMTLTE